MSEKEEQKEVQAPSFEGEEMKMPENSDMPVVAKESSVVNGPLIAILAILLVLILGGMYYWFSTITLAPVEPAPMPVVERPTPEENNEPESTTAEAEVEMAEQAVSTSDEVAAIEADLEATNLDALDEDLDALDAALEAALNSM